MSQDQRQSPAPLMSFKDFLERVPPGGSASVTDLATRETSSIGTVSWRLNLPLLELHCGEDSCAGVRLFGFTEKAYTSPETYKELFIRYHCRNCWVTTKAYALGILLEKDALNPTGHVYKYGENPWFGSPTPARVITLLGPEREYYLKGRRAENQGMGIGAFAYYRRVVENQKNRLLDEIIRVAKKIEASQEMLDDLNEAKNETQFTTAVSAIKHGIPSGLLLNGRNPLTLLHAALSEGLHAQTDEECLELATSIRVVLADLADRLGHALKERAELNAAVTRLLK